MNEREQIQQVCRWNRDLSRENQTLRRIVAKSIEAVARAGVERDTALMFLDSVWQAVEGKQQ